ncbi:phenylacetate-CoA oxygenase subunit PaaC [Natronomonas salina]|uniref:1,2-phenylacetyl-CoA epoxidase subunit PaaC n=1 Tax=Natronomonas salina TaxID=1710540 RepID=UPI0015B78962|nr:1,2-phenylacetyl-CoA epoxidase subunit PaaC [Natronomonas salina]QLD87706.1 phenylacetate-CoA oxygenase subunit PaaC [Natronomonas salina]
MTRTGEASLGGPDDLSERERAAVESELRCLADDEFVLAERYTEWQVRGPTLESDIGVANIAQDELGHARLWYDLLEDFGYDQVDLVWERDPSDFRHATLVERPFETGDWADCVVRGYLYDTYERLRLESLEGTTYPRIADRVGKVLGEEDYHREHAHNWLERLSEDGGTPEGSRGGGEAAEGRRRLQDALDRLFPHALTMFEPTEHESDVIELGVRPDPLADLRDDWRAIVTSFLTGLDLDVPGGEYDALLPDERGRDGTHTDAWESLYDEFTFTYRQLGRSEAPSLMPDPDEADV